jgi:hypothetical protein
MSCGFARGLNALVQHCVPTYRLSVCGNGGEARLTISSLREHESSYRTLARGDDKNGRVKGGVGGTRFSEAPSPLVAKPNRKLTNIRCCMPALGWCCDVLKAVSESNRAG